MKQVGYQCMAFAIMGPARLRVGKRQHAWNIESPREKDREREASDSFTCL